MLIEIKTLIFLLQIKLLTMLKNKDLVVRYFLIRKKIVQKKMLKALHTTIDDAIDTAGLPLIGVIPEDSDVPAALNRGIALRDFNFYAARAYENIARRLTGEKVPLMRI